jgi:hypothetical protein
LRARNKHRGTCPRFGLEASLPCRVSRPDIARLSIKPDGGVTRISRSRRVDRTARLQCPTRRRTRTFTSVTTTRQEVQEAKPDRVAICSTPLGAGGPQARHHPAGAAGHQGKGASSGLDDGSRTTHPERNAEAPAQQARVPQSQDDGALAGHRSDVQASAASDRHGGSGSTTCAGLLSPERAEQAFRSPC